MATFKDRVDSIYNGDDSTNPYIGLVDSLEAIDTILLTKKDIFTDGTTLLELTTQIQDYEDEVTTLSEKIKNIVELVKNHYEERWNAEIYDDRVPADYKTVPGFLKGGDGIKANTLERSNLPPVELTDTYFYKGSVTWADQAGNLDRWISESNSTEAILNNISSSNITIQNIIPINLAQGFIDQTDAIVSDIKTDFNLKSDAEITARVNSLKYVLAWSYASFLEDNPDDALVQELKTKFSGNLPE